LTHDRHPHNSQSEELPPENQSLAKLNADPKLPQAGSSTASLVDADVHVPPVLAGRRQQKPQHHHVDDSVEGANNLVNLNSHQVNKAREEALFFNENPSAMQQCASETSSPSPDCPECTMNQTCSCDGYVKFGYGSQWSTWRISPGNITCTADNFGDPYPHHNKICMCIQRTYTCATEWSTPTANCSECTMSDQCTCYGDVRFGYGTVFTPWQPVTGNIRCDASTFGDPTPGQGKVCECQPTIDMLNMYSPSYSGLDGVTSCIIVVIITYFIAFSAYNLIGSYYPGNLLPVLESLAATVRYAPMLSVLFFAAIKRAETLSEGNPSAYNLPPEWLKVAIIICTAAFCAQAALYAFCEIAGRSNSRSWAAQMLSDWFQVATALMYISILFVIFGVVFMHNLTPAYPQASWAQPAHGTICTIILAVGYFTIHLSMHALNTMSVSCITSFPSFWLEIMRLCAITMSSAPMLSVLFMGAQISMDWDGTQMTPKCEVCMYICTCAVLLQVILVIMTPSLTSAELQSSGPRVEFVTMNQDVFMMISIVRWILMAAMYIGIVIVFLAIWKISAVPQMTLFLVRLSVVFFSVYATLWMAVSLQQVCQGGFSNVINLASAAKDVVVSVQPWRCCILHLGSGHIASRMPSGRRGNRRATCKTTCTSP